jgi:hypothetical protein
VKALAFAIGVVLVVGFIVEVGEDVAAAFREIDPGIAVAVMIIIAVCVGLRALWWSELKRRQNQRQKQLEYDRKANAYLREYAALRRPDPNWRHPDGF